MLHRLAQLRQGLELHAVPRRLLLSHLLDQHHAGLPDGRQTNLAGPLRLPPHRLQQLHAGPSEGRRATNREKRCRAGRLRSGSFFRACATSSQSSANRLMIWLSASTASPTSSRTPSPAAWAPKFKLKWTSPTKAVARAASKRPWWRRWSAEYSCSHNQTTCTLILRRPRPSPQTRALHVRRAPPPPRPQRTPCPSFLPCVLQPHVRLSRRARVAFPFLGVG